MPHLTTDDGVKLYYEETGSGTPIVFVHEFAGDYRSWEPQVRHFVAALPLHRLQRARLSALRRAARTWRAIRRRAPRDDIRAVLDALKIDKAHIVGLSMGGFATLHFGLALSRPRARRCWWPAPATARSRSEREKFRNEAVIIAAKLEKEGMAAFAAAYAYGPTRVQFENKDPRGFAEFKAHAGRAFGQGRGQHAAGRAARAAVDLRSGGADSRSSTCRRWSSPATRTGPACCRACFIKRTCPSAALLVMPNSGHAINIEEPGAFNAAVADFLAQVDAGRWPMRDPRAVSQSITGMTQVAFDPCRNERHRRQRKRHRQRPAARSSASAASPTSSRRSGAANEALGRLTPEVVDKLHEQRLFRMLLPRAYGGEEVDLGHLVPRHGGAGQARRQHGLVRRPDQRLRGDGLRAWRRRWRARSGASRARR